MTCPPNVLYFHDKGPEIMVEFLCVKRLPKRTHFIPHLPAYEKRPFGTYEELMGNIARSWRSITSARNEIG
jgi:hypothetical protein